MRGTYTKALTALFFGAGCFGAAQAPYVVVDIHPAGFTQSATRGAGGGFQAGDVLDSSGFNRAALWNGGNTVQILSPTMTYTIAYGTDGNQVAGIAPGPDRALMWDVSTGNATSLHPMSGFDQSGAYGVGGGRQVGFGVAFDGSLHPLMWSGTASSVVDLAPTATEAVAMAAGGMQQVGYQLDPSFEYHAYLWLGSAASAVDLHPVGAGYQHSLANGTDGVTQVGSAEGFTGRHAAMWTGSAGTFVDLHPASGYMSSTAYACRGGLQVGSGQDLDGNERALAWNGSSGSVIDLHALLPVNYEFSGATGIDSDGSIVGWAYCNTGSGYTTHAVKWMAPPPPPPVQYSISNFKDPINGPGMPESVFKGNGNLQLHFTVHNSSGVEVKDLEITLSLTHLGTTSLPVNEPVVLTGDGDTDGFFKYRGKDYDYKLKLKNLLAGHRYRATATITSTGQQHSATFAVR